MKQTALNKETLRNALYRFLRTWSKQKSEGLELITTLRCCRQLLVGHAGQDTARPIAIVRELLDNGLATLAERHPNAANLLKQRFWDGVGVKSLIKQISISESQFYKLQNQAIEELTETILAQEKQAQFDYELAVESRLEPLAHQQLFGVDELRQQLYDAVVAPNKPWLISIEGLGGIGKTSLADRLVRELILGSRFFDVAWVSARQERFLPATGIRPVSDASERPALTADTLVDLVLTQFGQSQVLGTPAHQKSAGLNRLLKQQPYLIVVDNLETAVDYQALIPTLRQFANPSKFLLTSRHSLRAYADIFCLNATELSQADATALLNYEAQNRGLIALAQASPEQLTAIYQVVGGNPLALKLVLGQIHALPLSQVLGNLKQAQGRKTMELYTYIYWQSWQALSGVGRQTLLALPVASPRGSTVEHLQAVSGLQAEALSQALEELIAFSLVEVGGDLETRRYSIHRLTETFLLTEVSQWPSSP